MKTKIILGGAVGLAAAAAVAYSRGVQRSKQQENKGTEGSENKLNAPAGKDSFDKRSDGYEEPGSSMGRVLNGEAVHTIDDQGTTPAEASELLRNIRDNAFDGSNEKLALSLGRSAEEIENWTNGSELIDGDGLMKARALAIERGLDENKLSGEQTNQDLTAAELFEIRSSSNRRSNG